MPEGLTRLAEVRASLFYIIGALETDSCEIVFLDVDATKRIIVSEGTVTQIQFLGSVTALPQSLGVATEKFSRVRQMLDFKCFPTSRPGVGLS